MMATFGALVPLGVVMVGMDGYERSSFGQVSPVSQYVILRWTAAVASQCDGMPAVQVGETEPGSRDCPRGGEPAGIPNPVLAARPHLPLDRLGLVLPKRGGLGTAPPDNVGWG